MTMADPIRDYITTKLLTSDEEVVLAAEILLVMHDHGLLNTQTDETTGETLFSLREDVTEEEVADAKYCHEALADCPDDVWSFYVSGEIC